jgi:AcrR family transcriptional regulator
MPKIVDHEEQRRILLGRCFDLFRKRGYQSVTMREIAREIGASTGTLYHYFPNKLSILEQLFDIAVDTDLGSLESAPAKGMSPREKLSRLAEIWIRRQETTHAGLQLLALDLYRNSPAHSGRLLAGYAARYKEGISRLLGIDSEVSDAIFTYLIGANFHALLTPRHYSFTAKVRELERVLAETLAGRGPIRRRRSRSSS